MNIVINANTRHTFPLASESVQCAITSPPYYGLRDYGVNGQIGLERTPQEYVDGLVGVFREVWRVLRDDGVLWLNLGDSYASQGGPQVVQTVNSNRSGGSDSQNSGRSRSVTDGLKPKDLLMIPARVALALQADGWYLRSDIIWHKPNPMPESVTDRPTKAHEYIFLLSKSEKYFYDYKAIAEPAAVGWNGSSFTDERDQLTKPNLGMKPRNGKALTSPRNDGNAWNENNGRGFLPTSDTRNKRTVWTVATSPYSGAHFATFPPKLVEPMILAGSRPGDIVLDPFAGTATVGRVSIQHRRRFVGLELNPAYIELAKDRTSNVEVRMF